MNYELERIQMDSAVADFIIVFKNFPGETEKITKQMRQDNLCSSRFSKSHLSQPTR